MLYFLKIAAFEYKNRFIKVIHVDEGNLRNRFAFSIILFVRLKVNFYICVIAWNMKYEI